MRCPDCNKFVSYDEPQADVQSVEIDGDSVRANVSVQLNCQECGSTLKDAEIEDERSIDHKCAELATSDSDFKEGDEQYEIENDGDAEGTSRIQSTDRHGKPIKSARYMKSFYGFTLETEVKCLKCGETFSVLLEGDEQASSFNECC